MGFSGKMHSLSLRGFAAAMRQRLPLDCGKGIPIHGDQQAATPPRRVRVDDLMLQHGLWEAKDTDDDLKAEIKKKVAAGYTLTNILSSPTTTPSCIR